MKKFGRVLCPVDFSAASAAGLTIGRELAAALHAEVFLLHAIEFPHRSIAAERLYLEVEDEAGRRLQQERSAFADPERVQAVVLRGTPYERIVQFADEQNIDLIVMPTHGRRGVDRLVTGSVTERVLRLSRAAVVAVPAGTEASGLGGGPLLFATDYSDASDLALTDALSIARARDVPIVLLHVVALAPVGEYGQGWRFPVLPADVEQAEVAAAEVELEHRSRRVQTAGLRVQTRMVRGTSPAVEIAAAAAEAQASLLAVASHGHSGVTRALLGSTCEKLVRISPVPVLVVRPRSIF